MGRAAWAVVLGVGLVACGPSPLIRRASVEMGCPTEELHARAIGAGGWIVRGCGAQRSYTCGGTVCIPTETSGGSVAVVPARSSRASGARAEAPSPSSVAAAQWSNDSVRAMLASIHDDVLGCFGADHVPASIRIVIARTGHISDQSMVSEASHEELACATTVLQRVALDGGPRAPRTVVLGFAPRTQEIVPPGGAASTEPALDTIDVETAARAQIDARASTIVLCTDGASVAVALSWDASGTATVALRGHMHGTPEEACIQQAFAHVHVEAGGRAGSVLHPVEAPVR